MASGNYSILEAQLPLVGGVAGHDLLVLVDPDGNVIGEIDGLATGSNGQIKPIGYLPSDRLMTYTYSQAMYYSPNEAQVVLSSGSEDEIMSQWNAAVAAANEINQLNLPYPFMGLGSNSNSVASTLINAMGLSEPSMPGGASILPGAGTILLSQAVIQNIQQTYGISSIVGSAGSFLEGVETDNGVTTATVKNADGSYSVSTFSISPSGDGLSTLTGYNAQNVVQFVEINDVSASGQTSVSVSGQGAVVEQNGAAITIAPGSQATLGGANDLINPGGTDTLTLGANSASTTISIDNSGNVTVQDTSSTDGVSTTISLNSTDGSGSLAVGGQSVLNFGAGSSINVDAGSITVGSTPATGWTETAQLSQSGALTQTFDSTSSGGSIALTFSDTPGSISDTGPQLTGATLGGQSIDVSGIYSDIQSAAQTDAQGAAAQTGSLLTADQSAIQTALATGNVSSLPSDPEGWLTGLSSFLRRFPSLKFILGFLPSLVRDHGAI
ncbi:MAG: hypothetical protein RXR52_08465 [Paraburkholderia sp.]|uniref:hypothetical protein n=1 Tax=Burkholderiaceae TaxID=119060 RepID=UPI001BB2AED8|nr:hypothetical protein [Burkholderia sp. 4M9327F10]